MKSIKIYGLLGCMCLMMQSCLFSEEDVFEDSSAQRAIASVNEYKEVLESAENGWALKYYTGEGAEYGGYNIYAKFEGEYVTMASEIATSSYDVGENVTSLYKVSSLQGTQLSFDAYNEIIHEFCEPNGYNDPGYAGDYEFIFRSVSKDKIVLTGKKHGNILVMTPLPADLDWKTELTKIAVLADDAAYATYELVINGKTVTKVGQSMRAFTIATMDASGQVTTEGYPFMYTADGVEMYEPFTYGGVTMTHFQWDSESMTYTCKDAGVDAKIVFYCPEGYQKYLGNYILRTTTGDIECKLEKKRLGSTFSLKMVTGRYGVPVEFVFEYNVDTECIDLLSQVVGTFIGYDVIFYPGQGNNFYPYAGFGFNGKVISEDPLTVSFTFNKNDQSIKTILLLINMNGWALVDSYENPVLIKQD